MIFCINADMEHIIIFYIENHKFFVAMICRCLLNDKSLLVTLHLKSSSHVTYQRLRRSVTKWRCIAF